MSAHMPGPWKVCSCGKCELVFTRDARTVAAVTRREDVPLIAAAPDLLEAAEAYLAADAAIDDVDRECEVAIDCAYSKLAKARKKLCAAIEKARGK